MFRAIRRGLKYYLRPLLRDFDRELRNPGESQRLMLSKIVAGLSATEYGRIYKVRPDDDYNDYAGKLPVVTYDDLGHWISRQQETEAKVLAAEPILFYELTSGSSGAAKHIPYTKSLKASFSRMFMLWLGDLLEHGPILQSGKVFLSISPAFREKRSTSLGVRIGLDDDTQYLNGLARHLIKPFMVVPAEAAKIADPECYRLVLSASLLSETRLETISIWNPSFLEIILSYIENNAGLIASVLRKGFIRCGALEFRFKTAPPERIDIISNGENDWPSIWPELKLISCWTGAHASLPAQNLERRFPGVFIQGKGLLATEAPMTIPLINAGGCVPLPSEVFYEFEDDAGRIFRLHELEAGTDYEIIITQKGGLYRYRIGDMVRVTHFYRDTPCLDFIGRSDAVCDLVGEKLNERFVGECLEKIPEIVGAFPVMMPIRSDQGVWHYILLIDDRSPAIPELETRIENELCGAFHYKIARRLGQLGPVRVERVPGLRELLYECYNGRGIRLGDVKDCRLIRQMEISEYLHDQIQRERYKNHSRVNKSTKKNISHE